MLLLSLLNMVLLLMFSLIIYLLSLTSSGVLVFAVCLLVRSLLRVGGLLLGGFYSAIW